MRRVPPTDALVGPGRRQRALIGHASAQPNALQCGLKQSRRNVETMSRQCRHNAETVSKRTISRQCRVYVDPSNGGKLLPSPSGRVAPKRRSWTQSLELHTGHATDSEGGESDTLWRTLRANGLGRASSATSEDCRPQARIRRAPFYRARLTTGVQTRNTRFENDTSMSMCSCSTDMRPTRILPDAMRPTPRPATSILLPACTHISTGTQRAMVAGEGGNGATCVLPLARLGATPCGRPSPWRSMPTVQAGRGELTTSSGSTSRRRPAYEVLLVMLSRPPSAVHTTS